MRVYKTTFERELEEYLQDCEKRQLHLRTIRKYKQIGLRGYRYLKEGNLTTRPDKIGEREMNELSAKFNAPYFFTSAKNGLNVEATFEVLAEALAPKERIMLFCPGL